MSWVDKYKPFSQRGGYIPIPQPLKLGEVSTEFINYIQNIFSEILNVEYSDGYFGRFYGKNFLVNMGISYYKEILSLPIKDFKIDIFFNLNKNKFFKIFDIIEFALNYYTASNINNYSLSEFIRKKHTEIIKSFDKFQLAYFVHKDSEGIFYIMPRTTSLECKTLEKNLEDIKSKGLKEAEKHLIKAGKFISSKKWEDSIRESVHALESALRQILGNKKTLSDNLQEIKNGKLHPALIKSLSKMYAYASDEEGIRHSFICNNAKYSPDQNEALLILSYSASLCSYIYNKITYYN